MPLRKVGGEGCESESGIPGPAVLTFFIFGNPLLPPDSAVLRELLCPELPN